jgi:flagellar motility protein MotE (MotC chaperone)
MPASLTRAALLAALVVLSCRAFAASPAPEPDTTNGVAPVKPHADEAAAAPAAAPKPVAPAPTGSDAQRFCQNVAAAAAEARNAWQAKKLADLQTQVNGTIAELEARENALKDVLARREDALKRADATLVGIFGKMRPDAAAAQLSALDDETAAAVLQQLTPRAASAILDEIAPDRAAKLVTTIAAPPADGKKS